MTQENIELLIKDLCARLPYGVKVEYKNEIFDVEHVSPMYEEVKLDTYETWTIDVSDIKRGDVIRFGQNTKGLVNACEKVYDAQTKSFAYDTNPHNDLGADFYAALANVWHYKDGHIAITTDDSHISETLPDSAKILNLSGAKIYIYEIDSKGMPILTSGGFEDIVGYVNNGEYNSQVLINSHWFGVTELYIVK